MKFAFGGFTLDPHDRRLCREGAPVELNARYLDALALLVGEDGRLVSKERFMAEVWRGVPVTDEALTQCIRTLRRLLGAEAARPRFIETVPKHGYRFVAPVERIERETGARERRAGLESHPAPGPSPSRGGESPWRRAMLLGGAGTLGAAGAGVLGGLFYGFALGGGPGAASVLLVLLWLTVAAALIGGAGVSFGIAAGAPRWTIAGGALGGMAVGAVAKLLGLDAIGARFGESGFGPVSQAATGMIEGALFAGCIVGAMRLARRSMGEG